MISAFQGLCIYSLGLEATKCYRSLKEGSIPFKWKGFLEVMKSGLCFEG